MTRRAIGFLLVALVAFTFAFAFIASTATIANAGGPRWQVATVHSAQEGCGPAGLTMDVTYRETRAGVEVRTVLVDNDDAGRFPLFLTVFDEAELRYAGPNGHGRVGDGRDYYFVRGWERNDSGHRVRIGASDLNPGGWQPIRADQLTIRAVWAERRYCTVTLTIPAR